MTPTELFNSHIDLVSIIARKWHINGYDTDDLVQEGLIAFGKASERYDPPGASLKLTRVSVLTIVTETSPVKAQKQLRRYLLIVW